VLSLLESRADSLLVWHVALPSLCHRAKPFQQATQPLQVT
jgi:hypothetical protein